MVFGLERDHQSPASCQAVFEQVMLTLTADSMALRHQNCLGISFLRQRGTYFVSVKNSDFAQKSNEESSKPSAPCPN